MSKPFNAPWTRVANVRHGCIWCPEQITPGERYTLVTTLNDDKKPETLKFHAECYQVYQDTWSENDGLIYPHECKRGSTEHK